MTISNPWIPLLRDLASVSIDPVTKVETGGAMLAAGTMILDGIDILRRADAREQESVVVLTSDANGWLGFARVETSRFRFAVEQ